MSRYFKLIFSAINPLLLRSSIIATISFHLTPYMERFHLLLKNKFDFLQIFRTLLDSRGHDVVWPSGHDVVWP